MKLINVLTQLENETQIEPITRDQYRRSVKRFSEYLQRPARIDDLTPVTVNAYLAWLPERFSIGPTSVCAHRSGILRVWHYAADTLEIVEPCPSKRIRRPKVPKQTVRAWTLGDLDILLQCAGGMAGKLNCGIPAKDFMVCWLWVGYESGLRPSDMRLLRWADVDFSSSTITVTQHKTSCVHTSIFGPESRAALLRLREHGQERVFPLNKFGIRRWQEILFKLAENRGFVRGNRQGLGVLRKTHATEIYKQYGLAAAAESLGHTSGTTTARNHYVDSRERKSHLPPSPISRTG